MAGGGSLRDPGRNGQLAGVRDSPAPARGLLRSHLKHVHPISYAGVQGAHTRSHVLGLVPAGAAVTGLPVADPQEVDVPRSQRGQVPPACCAGARPAPSRPRPQHRPTWHTSAAVTSGSHSGVLVGWRSGRGRQVRHLRLSGPGPSIQVQTAVRRRRPVPRLALPMDDGKIPQELVVTAREAFKRWRRTQGAALHPRPA
jgi:hypothetical protein